MVMILYVAESSAGGIAEYASYQINALNHAGATVTLLCRPDFPITRLEGVRVIRALPSRSSSRSKVKRIFKYIRDARKLASTVDKVTFEETIDYILIDCFREYLAPFWAGKLLAAHRKGRRFGVVAHDPIRDFVVGPNWWHYYSIRKAYSFIDDVFVHHSERIDWGGKKPEQIKVHTIPHGPYFYPRGDKGRAAMRENYRISKSDKVFLSFGQIRDGKNLDVFLRAMVDLPSDVKLVVAGSGEAQSQKAPQHYLELARDLGILDRCVFEFRYIDDQEVEDFIKMSDVMLLIYSKKFVSASGVLSAAAAAELPVLASGGDGPVQVALRDYNIGEWIDLVDTTSVIHGVERIFANRESYDCLSYTVDHSWQRNAEAVIEAIGVRSQPSSSSCYMNK